MKKVKASKYIPQVYQVKLEEKDDTKRWIMLMDELGPNLLEVF